MNVLDTTLKLLSVPNRGILAADESPGTIHLRFEAISVENTVYNRNMYRSTLFSTPNLEKYLSGVILHRETFDARIGAERLVSVLQRKGIVLGVKVDQGLRPVPNTEQYYTNGLDSLEGELDHIFANGARFAKWRAVFKYSAQVKPSVCIVTKNCTDLAEFAYLCQQKSLVPVMEPEVICDDDLPSTAVYEAHGEVLQNLFDRCAEFHVDLNLAILKVAFVRGGTLTAPNHPESASATLLVLARTVPKNTRLISFLSGGFSPSESEKLLKATTDLNKRSPFIPNRITFSFGRALQRLALENFKDFRLGDTPQRDKIQAALLSAAKDYSEAL